jgi:hypothetical protein
VRPGPNEENAYSGDGFCRFKSFFAAGGELALQALTRRKPIPKKRLKTFEWVNGEKEAHGKFGSEVPGYCGAQDRF